MTTGSADFNPALLSSGSLVFFPTGGPVDLRTSRSGGGTRPNCRRPT
jgi:hypothetical protein